MQIWYFFTFCDLIHEVQELGADKGISLRSATLYIKFRSKVQIWYFFTFCDLIHEVQELGADMIFLYALRPYT